MKKYLIILWLLSCTIYLWGQEVSESLAVKAANVYYRHFKNARSDTDNSLMDKDSRTPLRFSPLGKANMWFIPVENGWILISGHKKATPFLAYIPSQKKPIYDSLPFALKELLNVYEENIFYIHEHETELELHPGWKCVDSIGSDESQNTPSAIGPKTLSMDVHWGQITDSNLVRNCDRYYNKYCPYVSAPDQCNRAAVGCVAVAVAQIMRYWNWPYAAYVPTTVGGSTTELKFYDWSQMPSLIDDDTPMSHVNMIAGFLRDCGYSLDMDYGVSSSASIDDALSTLEAFGYDDNAMEVRNKSNTSGWTNKLRTNIDNGQPIYYRGSTANEGGKGHAFIVDGYRTGDNPTFHINWGWYGGHDNWYNIDDAYVDPTHHYEYNQSAIFGIRPAPICSEFFLNGSIPFLFTAKFSLVCGGNITLGNNTLSNITQGQIYSSTQVRLLSGFKIQQGSNVHIAIKKVPCPTNTISSADMEPLLTKEKSTSIGSELEEAHSFAINPNPVRDILIIETTESLSQIDIYNVNGQCVLQTKALEISVAHLPTGMYILRAKTKDGRLLQSKFIKQ